MFYQLIDRGALFLVREVEIAKLLKGCGRGKLNIQPQVPFIIEAPFGHGDTPLIILFLAKPLNYSDTGYRYN